MSWTSAKTPIASVGQKGLTEYTAQIYPFGNTVFAEILCRNEKDDFKSNRLGLWLTIAEKEFGGGIFSRGIKEKDFERAKEWVNGQLEMIERHATVVIVAPRYLVDLKREIDSYAMRI